MSWVDRLSVQRHGSAAPAARPAAAAFNSHGASKTQLSSWLLPKSLHRQTHQLDCRSTRRGKSTHTFPLNLRLSQGAAAQSTRSSIVPGMQRAAAEEEACAVPSSDDPPDGVSPFGSVAAPAYVSNKASSDHGKPEAAPPATPWWRRLYRRQSGELVAPSACLPADSVYGTHRFSLRA